MFWRACLYIKRLMGPFIANALRNAQFCNSAHLAIFQRRPALAVCSRRLVNEPSLISAAQQLPPILQNWSFNRPSFLLAANIVTQIKAKQGVLRWNNAFCNSESDRKLWLYIWIHTCESFVILQNSTMSRLSHGSLSEQLMKNMPLTNIIKNLLEIRGFKYKFKIHIVK